MVKSIIIALFISCLLLSGGCTPKLIEPIKIPTIEMQERQPFIPNEKIEKPKKPNPILLEKDFAKTNDENNIEYFAFNKEEFAKIIQLSMAFDAQDKVIDSYTNMINLEIDINNDLKNLVNNKTNMEQYFADLYVNEQNLRLQENYQYEKQKFFDKLLLFIQSTVLLGILLK